MAKENHFNAKLSFKDNYYFRLHIPKDMNLKGNVISVDPLPTNSSNPTERLLSVAIREGDKPITECLIKKEICEERGIEEGDTIECDFHPTIKDLPNNVSILFCASISKNESQHSQKQNIEKSLPETLKSRIRSIGF